jgi:hypothetical protein
MFKEIDYLFKFWIHSSHFVPGVLLPAVVAVTGLSIHWRDFHKHIEMIFLCITVNAALAIGECFIGADNGLHLVNLFIVFVVFASRRQPIHPAVAFAATWVSLVVVDVPGAYLYDHWHHAEVAFSNSILEPLEWVGGGGWLDALILSPTLSAMFARVLPLVGWTKLVDRDFAFGT